jgi:hypothetical protein
MNNLDNLKTLLDKMVAEMRDNLAKTKTNASGRTSASLRVVMTDTGGQIWGRRYFRGVEQGRAGGRVPHNFTSIIEQWIVDKGLSIQAIQYKRKPSASWQPKYTPEERGLRQMASAIARTIEKSGTSLYRSGGRQDIFTNVIEENKADILKVAKEIITTNLYGKYGTSK